MHGHKCHVFRAIWIFWAKRLFWGGIFCLEYPSRRSEKVNFHFANYRFSFRKLQIFISQTTDSHFANYRFSFRKLQILISQTTDFHFTNYRFTFRKLQIFISQTTDFHFANYRFWFRFVPFRFVSLHFVLQTTVSLITPQNVLPARVTPAWVHPGSRTRARISLRYEISQRYHVNAKRPPISVWNLSVGRLERVAHA